MIPVNTIVHGDNLHELRKLPDNSVDSFVVDGPYGIGFMGKAWDGKDIEKHHNNRESHAMSEKRKASGRKTNGFGVGSMSAKDYICRPTSNQAFQLFTQEWATEAIRILKPGGHLLSFCSPRTYHRMVCGIEDAGFEIRDTICWLFGSGFPKSHNLTGDFKGWGTALKPAMEPICVARKPFKGTVAENVFQHGTGALNIDISRVETNEEISNHSRSEESSLSKGIYGSSSKQETHQTAGQKLGRWPANVIHDGSDEVGDLFPESNGQQGYTGPEYGNKTAVNCYSNYGPINPALPRSPRGSAARFFYCAKASAFERNAGLESFSEGVVDDGRSVVNDTAYQRGATLRNNIHPTVKPIALMLHLVRLVTPPGGIVVDPFAGSGTTCIAAKIGGFQYIGMEKCPEKPDDPNYIGIARARVEWWNAKRWDDYQAGLREKPVQKNESQTTLFDIEEITQKTA